MPSLSAERAWCSAARTEESLRAAAQECERAGGRALAVPTDVTDEVAVQALARRADEAFGRIDVWVNAAAVIAYGEFEKTPTDVYRQVIETNLFGQIHGARAVLPYFRRQNSGILINIASIWGSVPSPYVSAYVVSKFGVRAFSESLQEALRLERRTRDIHVCTILPQCVVHRSSSMPPPTPTGGPRRCLPSSGRTGSCGRSCAAWSIRAGSAASARSRGSWNSGTRSSRVSTTGWCRR
ncbi:MAG TPA: SDR family NAD(P)-dependent oxidoreductase [Pseudonocardiaceae bacterium]|nr:SDR family NAD(P)-dependent oxidoreductase [Pseudonocardiaceae bacterium]